MTNDVFGPGQGPARHVLIDGMETYAKKDREGGNWGYMIHSREEDGDPGLFSFDEDALSDQ